MSFLRKKKDPPPEPAAPAAETPAAPAEPRPPEASPGVQMLKQVWRIDTRKRRREMPPDNVPTSIYAVPHHHGDVPRRKSKA